jgi:hypothetical protein
MTALDAAIEYACIEMRKGVEPMKAIKEAAGAYGLTMSEVAIGCSARSARKRQQLAAMKRKSKELAKWNKVKTAESPRIFQREMLNKRRRMI